MNCPFCDAPIMTMAEARNVSCSYPCINYDTGKTEYCPLNYTCPNCFASFDIEQGEIVRYITDANHTADFCFFSCKKHDIHAFSPNEDNEEDYESKVGRPWLPVLIFLRDIEELEAINPLKKEEKKDNVLN